MAIITAEMMREAWRQHCVRAGMAGTGGAKVRGDRAYYAKVAYLSHSPASEQKRQATRRRNRARKNSSK